MKSPATAEAHHLPANGLSIAVIATNEAHQLPGLVPSLDFAAELLLIDGGSTDGTAALARELGMRVSARKFDHFAAQRNFALSQARSPWVLFVDADERPTPALRAEVLRRIQEGPHVAWRVPIRSRILGHRFRFSGTQDDCPIRLVRRDTAHWYAAVHEVARVTGPVGTLRSCLLHETMPDLDAILTKIGRYSALAAHARIAAGIPPRIGERWSEPLREVVRRLFWKQGCLDGPRGWKFCLLSGLSAWVLADQHRRLWNERENLVGDPGAACSAGVAR